MQEVRVPSLVGEPRSRMLCSAIKKIIKKILNAKKNSLFKKKKK